MKHLIFLLLSMTFCTTSRPSNCIKQVSIEHIGVCDKPLFTLVFSTKMLYFDRAHDEGQNVVVLDENEFAMLELDVSEFDASVSPETPTHDFGTFSIKVNSNCKSLKLSTYNHATSKSFFKTLFKRTEYFRPDVQVKAKSYITDIVDRL